MADCRLLTTAYSARHVNGIACHDAATNEAQQGQARQHEFGIVPSASKYGHVGQCMPILARQRCLLHSCTPVTEIQCHAFLERLEQIDGSHTLVHLAVLPHQLYKDVSVLESHFRTDSQRNHKNKNERGLVFLSRRLSSRVLPGAHLERRLTPSRDVDAVHWTCQFFFGWSRSGVTLERIIQLL
jgi:hypothetical protein